MSTHNIINGSGEDDHQYDVRELFRPSKALRTASAADDTTPAQPLTKRGGKAASAGRAPSADLLEQIRDSKRQAIEVLQVISADTKLEYSLSDYIRDIEASYNESDPKITFPKLRAAWTPEEDRLLMVGVRVYGPNTESWPRIAMLVPGRTNKSCRKRWFHSLDPSLHKGPWTQEEDDLLRERVAQYPSQWSRVAEGITGRTDDQCAKRWRESLDPEIERGKWTPEEDRLLLDKFAEFGTQWQKIATFFQGRPGLHCRNRWRKIQRIISQKERRSGGALSADDLSKTLASVTESVNRRKTAQRSRPQSQGFKQALGSNNHSAQAKGGDCNEEDDDTGGLDQVDQQPLLDAPRTGFSEDAASHCLYYSRPSGAAAAANSAVQSSTPVSAQASGGSRRSGLSGSIGALFMPSEHQPAPLSPGVQIRGRSAQAGPFKQQTVAKRTSSVLFSPTEEQRQRLRNLGRRLYGCAATPESCSAAFADPMSLNTHIKLAHPSVAGLIPSLSVGAGQAFVGMSSSPDTSNDDIMDILANQSVHQPPSFPTASSTGVSPGEHGSKNVQQQLKPYRCAMFGCNHAYKNVNGLEYHIFHSRKSNNHLLPDPGQTARDAGSVDRAGEGPFDKAPLDMLLDGSYSRGKGDMRSQNALQCAEVECLATFDTERDLKQHILSQHPRPIRRAVKPSNRVRGQGGNTPRVMTPVESFSQTSSNPVFWGTTTISEMLSVAAGVASSEPTAAIGSANPNPTAPMPTIPESGTTPLVVTADATGHALGPGSATHPGLGHRSFTGNLVTQSTFANNHQLPFASPLAHPQQLDLQLQQQQQQQQQQLRRHHMQHPGSFMQNNNASAPFLSAPALISANGGEPPSIESYFALNLNGSGSAAIQHNTRIHPQHSLTPSVYGPTHMTSNSIMPASAHHAANSAASSMFMDAINHANAVAAATAAAAAATVSNIPSGQLDNNTQNPSGQDLLSAENMQFMNSMLSPAYMHGPTRSNTGDTAAMNESPTALASFVDGNDGNDDNDIHMTEDDDNDGSGKVSVRSRRSDSIDLTSLATVPNANQQPMGPAYSAESPPLGSVGDSNGNTPGASIALSKSGVYSQMAAALMSRRGRQQQMAAAAVAAAAMGTSSASSAEYGAGSQDNTTPTGRDTNAAVASSWGSNDITALGLLMAASNSSQQQQQQQSPRETRETNKMALQQLQQQQQQQQRHYTPQYPDLAQFQEQQYHHNIAAMAAAAAVAHNGTTIIRCAFPGCQQVFNDANALKYHLQFDHPRDQPYHEPPANILSTFNNTGSNPASPIDLGGRTTLSTMPVDHKINSSPQQTFMNHLMAVQGYVPGAMSQPIGGMDRTKAPHWIEPNLWEMWIAAAHGHDSSDVAAAAAATAMGITPGVTGGPQSFLPPTNASATTTPSASHRQQPYTNQQQHPVDNELLHMFESVNSKSSKINSSSPLH
ncbi:hypothetical protein EV178_004406 [Coemansia sp. RSA 1646]|nr:hypothetical protein EV178_004406 [Coemansia sp. RSA 1646]